MFQLVSNVCFCSEIDFEAFGCICILCCNMKEKMNNVVHVKYICLNMLSFFSFLVSFSFLYYSMSIINMMKSVVELVETLVSQLP